MLCDRSIGADIAPRIDRAAMEDVENASMEQMKKMMNYPLIKNCDMTEEMRQDCSDLVITAVEKHANNFEAAARLVKEAMDKKYNESWVVVIGEGFSFEVTHQVKHVLWMYTSNSVAVLVYKGAPAAVSAVARCRPLPPPPQPRRRSRARRRCAARDAAPDAAPAARDARPTLPAAAARLPAAHQSHRALSLPRRAAGAGQTGA